MFSISAELDALVTGRRDSFLKDDWERHADVLRGQIRGSRILVVGGAGSIGRATIELIARFRPRAVHVLDINENALAELVRSLRNQRDGLAVDEFRTLPLDFGSAITERYLADMTSFDAVLNFAAIKHVRSEKDTYSVLQMLDTNVVKQARFKAWLAQHGHASSYFAVSTDKAANPASLLGASKRLMEDVVFADPGPRVAAARFANVAFSNGSLLESFMIRFASRQALAAPRDVRRYFVTRFEAAQICALAAFIGPHHHVVFPDFAAGPHLALLSDVAAAIIRHFGLEPVTVEDEETARATVDKEMARGRYPLLVTPRDTSGEKPFEEFVAQGEVEVATQFKGLKAIAHHSVGPGIGETVTELDRLIREPGNAVDKDRLVEILRVAVPTLKHIETGLGLDQRM